MAGLNQTEKAQFDRAIATLNKVRAQVAAKRGNENADTSLYLDGSGNLCLMVAPDDSFLDQGNIVHEGRLHNASGGDW